jgi:hypothetical protein
MLNILKEIRETQYKNYIKPNDINIPSFWFNTVDYLVDLNDTKYYYDNLEIGVYLLHLFFFKDKHLLF